MTTASDRDNGPDAPTSRPFVRPYDALSWLARNSAAIFLLSIVVVVIVGVVARYVLAISLPWAEEVARKLLVWLTFLGAAAATATRSNIRVDTILGRLSGNRRWVLEVVGIVLSILALVILIWASRALFGPGAMAISPGSGIPAFWTRIALPVAGGLMILFMLKQLWDLRHAPPPPSVEEMPETREEV